jgi:hypothetical protein
MSSRGKYLNGIFTTPPTRRSIERSSIDGIFRSRRGHVEDAHCDHDEKEVQKAAGEVDHFC